jgi:hypothetical protein
VEEDSIMEFKKVELDESIAGTITEKKHQFDELSS